MHTVSKRSALFSRWLEESFQGPEESHTVWALHDLWAVQKNSTQLCGQEKAVSSFQITFQITHQNDSCLIYLKCN